MYRTKFAVRCFAAVAAAALLAGCGGGDVATAEDASSVIADSRVRTPLVDDEGWPMPADPPSDGTSPAGGQDGATK